MSFTVTRLSLPAPFPAQHTWPLRAEVVSTDGSFPAEIFCYHRGQNGQAAFAGDIFENVASIHDMQEYGLEATLVDGKLVPFYRSSKLVFDCRTAEEADALWEDILDDIKVLLRNAAAKDNLQVQATLTL